MKKEGILKRVIEILSVLLVLLGIVILSTTTEIRKFSTPKFIDAYTEVASGENATATPYVTFDAYFETDGVKYRGIHQELNSTANLVINLNVQTNGTLKDAKITFDSDKNYTMITNIATDDYISSVTSSTIKFSDIPLGVNKTINATLKQNAVNLGNFNYITDNLSKTNKVTLTGTHVATDGTETEISKDVYFNIDWYGDISINRYADNYTENKFILSEEEGKIYIVYTSYAYTNDISENATNKAPDKAAIFETVIPQMEGYDPIDVYVEDIGIVNRTLTYEYDETTRTLTSRMEAVLGENGSGDIVVYGKSYKQNIVIVYPIEAYTSTSTGTYLNAESKVYAEGYSTDSDGNIITVTSEPVENTLQVYLQDPQGDVFLFDANFSSSYLTKTNMRINYQENKDIRNGYKIDWEFNLSLLKNFEKIIFEEDYSNSPQAENSSYKEDTDHFSSADGTYYDLDGIVAYEAIRVENSAFSVLGEEGYLNVYNAETDELVKQITYADVGKIVVYDNPIEHIRVETSAPTSTGDIVIEHLKIIDNEKMMATYDEATFETFETLNSAIKGSVKYTDSETVTVVNGDIATTNYNEGYSLFEASLSSNAFYPQKLNTNSLIIQFKVPNDDDKDRDYIVWKDPVVFVEFPEEFTNVIYNSFSLEDLDEVTITNTTIEEIDGKQVLKIYTSGFITEAARYTLKFQANVDEFTTEAEGNIRVFASNGLGNSARWYYSTTTDETDIYDVDGDADITETVKVENNTVYYSQVNQLATTTQITDFDGKGTIVEGPNVAKVDKNVTDTARINILVSNGYTDVISNVKIVGRIPFEGNTYVINGTDIGSKYSTTINNTGIISADGLTNYTVYYSENATANNDLTDTANGWTTTPTDWSAVKSYMIDFGTETLTGKTSYKFYYDVTVPSGLDYGSVTYATHAVYFDSLTATGLSTETDKVGLMFASEKQFNLQVNSYKYNTDELICSSKDDKYYSYTSIYMKGEGIDDGETYKFMATSTYYAASKSELNTGVIYTIKQNSLTGYYLKSDEEISFRVNAVDGELQLEILSGNPRGTAVFEDNTVKIDFENVFKYNIEVRNKYKGTDTLIKGSTHKVNGLKNNNWVDKDGNTTDGSMLLTTGVGSWTNVTADTWTLEQTAITDTTIIQNTDIMNFTITLGEDNEYAYSDLVNLTSDQITYTNTYTVPPKFSISVYNEFKDATVNVYHYLKDTTTSIADTVVITGKYNDTYTTTVADIDTKKYKLVSTSDNTEGTMLQDVTDVYYYYEEQYYDYTVEYYYDGVKDDTKTETLSAPYGVFVHSYPSKKIDGYELEKADGLPLTISDDTTQNVIKVYYVAKTTLPVTIDKTSSWIDVEQGIAKVEITDRGEAGTEPMDVLLIVDTSQSMIFNDYANMGYSSPCLNTAHWTTGSHLNDAGTETTETENGCIDRLTVTKGVLNNFTTSFMEKNAENRIAVVNFSISGNLALDFTNDLTTVQTTITNLEADNAILGGTYYEKGFEQAYTAIQTRNTNESGDASINSRKTVLVFLTDGSPSSSSTGNLGSWGDWGDSTTTISAEEYANLLKGMGVQIYTNGIGINETDNADACDLLKSIATDGDTDFATTDTAEGLADIYDNISNDIYFAGENATITDIIDENWVYYEDDTHKPSPTENMTVNGQTVTWTQDVISSEETFSFYIKLKDNESDTYADGTWDTNDSAILNYTNSSGEEKSLATENPNLTRKKVTVNHYIDGTTTKLKDSETIKYKLIGDTVSATAIDSIEGYNLISNTTQTVTVAEGTNEINFYYSPRTDLSYTVEYYLNGTKDDTLTETVTGQTYGSTITTHTPQTVKGYMVEKTEGLPLTIGIDETQNIIKVYLVTDPSQTTKISYVVLFYKDGEMVTGESVNESVTVQYLEHFAAIDKDAVNFENRYEGYKPVKVEVEGDYKLDGVEYKFDDIGHITELSVLPDEVSNLTYISVYYEKDYTQTKDLTYTIEYYKDGVLADSEIKTENIYVLSSVITIPEGTINITDKYEGYEFDSETTGTIPTYAWDGDVIKIYYKIRTDLSYRVEYYIGANIDNSLTKTFTNQTFGTVINTYPEEEIYGYAVVKEENLPLTIGTDESKNVIKITYGVDDTQTKELTYVVWYFKDGEYQAADLIKHTITSQVLEDDYIPVAKEDINIVDMYYGYKLEKITLDGEYKIDGVEYPDGTEMILPDEIKTASIIGVYYVIDDSQTKKASYTVEYYKDGEKQEDDTQTVTKDIQVLENTLAVDKTEINTTDKYTGYKLASTEPATIPDAVADGETIKVYYEKDSFGYSIEYYYDGVKDDSKTETGTAIFESTIDTYTDKVIDGYAFEKVEGKPLTITENAANNIMKVYYVKRTDFSYTVKYLEQGTNVELAPTKTVENQTFASQVTETAIDIEGYDKVAPTEATITIATSGNEITFYYAKRTDLEYRVEYYFNGVIDDTLTDTFTATYLEEITTYEDKVKPGYKFSSATTPITIGVGENVIKIYYVTDPDQTKILNYTIKYYKDGVHVTNDDIVEEKEVQYLDSDVIVVNTDDINIIDKYDGYKYEKTEIIPDANYPELTSGIPEMVNDEAEINIYYVKNSFDYSIEYYYEGTKDDSKTETGTAIFESTIDTYTDKVVDGYVLEKVEGQPITITSNPDNNIMKVYYIKRTDLSYTVKYLEQDTNVELAPTKTVENQTFASQVTESAINIEGYDKVAPTESTITIATSGNEITFYYTKRTDLSYRVEYYFNGTIDNTLTETIEATYLDVITTYENKVKAGYKYESDTAPITIGTTENVIKVYYVTDEAQTKDLSYTVEYYKDGVKVEEEVENTTVQVLQSNTMSVAKEKINVTDKYNGYRFVGTEPEIIPDAIADGETIKVYYEKDSFGYSIEYYYDGAKDDSKTETGTAVYQSTINDYTDKVIDGYTFEKVEGNPITITENAANNIMKVYYVKRIDLSYIVKYLEQDTNVELAPTKTVENQTFESQVTETAIDIEGYDKVAPTEATITVATSGNEITFYYTKRTDLSYRVEYYFNNEIDDSLTETITATYLDEISTYTDKVKPGYKFESATTPIIIGVGENVIKVYYVTDDSQMKTLKYTVEYYKDGVIADTEEFEEEKQLLESDYLTVDKNAIDTISKYVGYVCVSFEPETIPDEIINGGVIKVYYEKDIFEYTIEYYYDGEKDDSKTETGVALYQSTIDTYTDKVVEGYVLEKVEKIPLTISANENSNIAKVYYIKRTDLSYTVKYLEQGTNLELATSKTVENQTFASQATETAIDIEGYDKVAPTEVTLTIATSGNEIIFYYTKRTDLEYRVEYYFDGVIDDTLTDTFTATYLDEITTYEDKLKTGYKFESATTPITIGVGENVIRVYYITDESVQKTLTYVVRYFKDDIHIEADDYAVSEEVQYLEPNTMTVRKNEINIVDKYDGYKFEKILVQEQVKQLLPEELTELPDEVESYAIIDVYYVKDSFDYSIEYYYEGTKDDSKTETGTALFESSIDTYTNKVIDGYVLEKVEGQPITITSNPDNNIMKVYYVKRTDLSYTVKYLEQGTNAELAPTKTIENQTFESQVTESALNIEGYDKVAPTEVTRTIGLGANEITFYYTKRTDLSYRVEYYFNGTIDNTLTETITATYLDEITTYEDKVKPGYKFESATTPITIGVGENVIKVYYVTDDSQTKELKYTVEYYKDGVIADTEEEKTTVQLLQPDTMAVDKSKINTTDKYVGYKLDAATEAIPDTVTNGTIIKIYYIIDDGNTKDLKYTVEYYKDGVIADTEEFGATVQILNPDILTVKKESINTVDKYAGYRLANTDPETIPDEIADGGVIKVYYEKDQFEYKVEYYYDANIDDSKTETLEATYQDVINTYTDKVIDGYTLDEVVGLPLTIDYVEANNIIKVYYVKDVFEYSIEYFYNGVKDDTKTEYYSATFADEITEYTDNTKAGYKFSYTENNPLTITSDATANIMKVYYVTDDSQTKEISYTVEYYKDGVKADEDTVRKNVQLLEQEILTVDKDAINVTDKYDGYKFVGTEPEAIPDEVTTGTIIKVNYEKDTFEYTVEYYFEGIKDDSKTERNTALFEEVINTYTDKVEVGYKLSEVIGTPLTITSNPANNVIKVYYVIDEAQTKDLSYTVEYYKDGVKVEEEVENTTVQVLQPDTMSVAKDEINVTDKYDGYKFVGTEPEAIPDEVTTGTIIKVNYEKDTFEYTVEYYFEGIKDDSKTEVNTALFEEVINTYTDKVEVGYKLSEVVGTPLTITSNPANNVIKVYYVIDDSQTKEISYKVEYYKDGAKADEDIKAETVQILAEEILTVDKDAINTTDKYFGYEFVNTDPETIPDEIANGGVIKVYYELDSENVKELKYTVEYYKDGVFEEKQEFTSVVQVLAEDILTVDKTAINTTDKYYGYKFVNTNPEVIPDEIANGEIIKVYYVIDEAQTKDLSYTVEYYKDGVKVEEEVENTTVQVLQPDTMSVAKEKINVTDKYDGYKFVGTEPEAIPDEVTTGTIIKVNYEKDTFEYTVEYYFEGIKDDSKTETNTALFEEVINTYTDKVEVGYKLSEVIGTPLTITSNPANNVIKVYYVIDEAQTKDLSYTVEYYKDGVKVEEEVETTTVQVLQPDTMSVAKDKINVTDKYFGYKFVNTDPEVIPDEIANGEVIKIYYEIDNSQTKEISYKVEYYKDGIKADEDIKTETVQVLAEEILAVDKNSINVTDKYFGYEFVNTDPEVIPDEIANGEVIKVYYELDSENVKELKYTVEYYKDGVFEESDVTTKVVQILEADTLEVDKNSINVTDKYFGYKFINTDPETIPDVVNTDSVIKVYYEIDEAQTKELSYKVEYYKDGVKVEEEVETTTVQVLQPDTMTVAKDKINVTDKYDGYRFVGTEPEAIPDEVTTGTIIKVNYEKDTFEYTVEYYFDNVKDDNKTETNTALFEEVIDTYTDKVEVGYKLSEVVGTPLTITSNPANNVIKVYYVIDEAQTKDLSYKVEYYKDGVKVEEEVETTTVQVLQPDTMTVAKDEINVTDKYDGYKFVGTEPEIIPDTANNGDIIKVNYEKDTFEYTVEYYFDGIKDDSKTEVNTALFEEVIDTYTDKVEVGYKLSEVVGIPLTITSNPANNIIKVYYVTDDNQTKEIGYTVEYYKEGTLADTDEVVEVVQILDEEILAVNKDAINMSDKYFGYKFISTDPETIPDEIANGEVIKVYYEIDEAQTKELSYTVEYYKDGVKVEEEVETTTDQVLQPDTMLVAKEKINVTDKYDGYKFVGTEPEEIPDEVTTGTIIKVNYEKDTFEYTVEYYFDNVKDDNKTETNRALFEEVIDAYTDKVEVGYKLSEVIGTPLTITSNPANNIIKVYYVTDDTQTKELSYAVEYYKDGILADTEVEKTTVQILAEEVLAVNKDAINITDKYFGYKFVSTDPETIPDEIANGEVIKVYYEIDEENTKELKYTVEYYKDGVKVDENVTTKVVQILEADTLEVDKTEINTNDKYDGYKFVGTEPEEIPDEVTTGTIIKVNYEKDTFEYTVEYYFDNVKDENKTETNTAIFEEVVDTYTDKVEVGYKFDKVEGTPLTITSNPANNVIKVYYVTDDTQTKEISYKVEYYKDGTKADEDIKTETVQVLAEEILIVNKDEINTTDKYIGYKFDTTEPAEIPDTVNNGDIIKVFYVKDSFEYRIEYYYENVRDDSKTEIGTALYQETINTYEEKVIEGYTLEREENLPLVVSENSEDNVIKVFYVIDDKNTKQLSYTVEYYKDGELADTEVFTEVVQILEDDTLEVKKDEINVVDKYVGYEFDKTEPAEIPDTVNNGDVIKVFYVKGQFEYKVEYYYAGEIDDSKTDILVANYGDTIENVENKVIEGYKFDRAENFPLVVSENAENNVIKIYYIIDNDNTKEISYTVEYYKDGVLDEESTQVVTKTVQVLQPDVLDVNKADINLVDKYDGYKLDAANTQEVPNIVNDGEVIKVYYIRKDASVVVKYYEQNSENALAEEVTIEGKVFDEYSTEAKEIEGYTLVNTTENTEGQMTEDPIVVIYYYAKEADVVVKHIDKNTGEVIEEEVIPSKDGDIVETLPKDIPEYVLVESPEETTVQVEKEDIEVIYIYVKVSAGVIEKHIDVKSGEILETNTYEGNEGDPYKTTPKEFEGYDLVMEQYPENEEGVMTEEVIEVRYYYIRKATLKVEYVDINTGEVIEDETVIVEGHEGDTYEPEEKELDGYVLIEKPENEEIVLVVEPSVDEEGNIVIDTETNVVYKYAREAKVVVEHIDITTGEKLLEDEVIEGYEGKEYTTESKEIERYVLVEEPANKEGEMKVEEVVDEATGETTLNDTTVVTYKYDKQPAKVIVRYINKLTGEIFSEEEQNGKLDEEYRTEAKEFEGYRFLNDEYPENAEGVYTEETIIVNYYYMKITKVIVYYVDNVTGELVSSEIEIDGYEGEDYVTTPIEIPGYILVEEKYPENASGKHDEDEEKVYYYYVRETSVEVTYIDKETGEELAEKVIIEGKEGDTYTTEEKEIPYYELVKVNEPEGEMKSTVTKDEETGEEIVDTVTRVVYEYRKSIFDLKIEKTITEILVNGSHRNVGNNKLVKAEIHRKKIADSVVKVVYQIKVTNDGEVEGSAIISDRLPEGMIFNTSDNPGWTEKGELLYRETDTLKPGESAVYEIILYWNGTKEIGTFTNQAEIVSTENVPDYEDTDSKDDKSEASIIIVTSTGIELFVDQILLKDIANKGLILVYILLASLVIIKRKKD